MFSGEDMADHFNTRKATHSRLIEVLKIRDTSLKFVIAI